MYRVARGLVWDIIDSFSLSLKPLFGDLPVRVHFLLPAAGQRLAASASAWGEHYRGKSDNLCSFKVALRFPRYPVSSVDRRTMIRRSARHSNGNNASLGLPEENDAWKSLYHCLNQCATSR